MGEKEQIIQQQIEFELKPMDDTNNYVFKSHNLIESGYNFTLNEQRLTYLASKKLKPRYIKSNLKKSQLKSYIANETFKDIRIHVNEFKESFNLKSNNLYTVLKDTADSLYEKSIQYMQDDGSFVKKRWVTTCKYNEEGKYVEIEFHPDLILDLLVIKGRFGKMNYESAKKFKTSYAFRIYELLQNYAYKGDRVFEIEDLRYKLGIYDDKKYKQFADFKKYVLDKSIESINASTNLDVSYETIRYGRKVGSIKFNISQKTLKEEIEINNSDDIDIIDKSQVKEMENIIGIKLSAGTVAKISDIAIDSIREYNIDMGFYEYIKYEMDRVKDYSRIKKIENPIACLKTALSEYWRENNFIPKNSCDILNQKSFNNFTPTEYNYDKLEAGLVYGEEVCMDDIRKK